MNNVRLLRAYISTNNSFSVLSFKSIRYLVFAYDKYMPYSYLLKTHGAPYAQKQITEDNELKYILISDHYQYVGKVPYVKQL